MAAKKSVKRAAKARPAKKSTGSSAKKPAAKGRAPSRAARSTSARPKAAAKPGAKKRVQLKSRRPSPRPKRAPRPAGPKAVVPENPAALSLARKIAHIALDKKANDVVIIDTRARGAAVGYDYVVIASGDSDRQLEAISDAVDEALRPTGTRPAGVEASADWVLANYQDVVAHFFTPEVRGVYDLQGLWSDAPRVPLE